MLGACVFSLSAQTISYFNSGFLRQPSAEADRDYLGVTAAIKSATNGLTSSPWHTSGNDIYWQSFPGGKVILYDVVPTANTILGIDGSAWYSSIVTGFVFRATKKMISPSYSGDGISNLEIDGSGKNIDLTGGDVILNGNVIYGNGAGLTNLPCCTNGAFIGSFTGDGSGLTNAVPSLFPATNSPLGSLSYDGANWYWRTVVNGTNGINGTNGATGPAGPAGTNAASGLVTNVWTTNLTGQVLASTISGTLTNNTSGNAATATTVTYQMAGSANGSPSGASVYYLPLFGYCTIASANQALGSETNYCSPVGTTSRTVSNLFLRCNLTALSTTNLTCTVVTNGVATAMSFVLAGNGTWTCQFTNSGTAIAILPANGTAALKMTCGSALATRFYWWTMELR